MPLSFWPRLLFLSSPRFWFWLVVVCNLLYFFLEHEGLYHQDDYSYAKHAYDALQGRFCATGSIFCHRLMVTLPTAAVYAVLGVGPYTTTLYPLLCTLGTYGLLYQTFQKEYPVAISWTLVFLGLFYFLLNTVNYLYPDNLLLFYTTACLLILYKTRGKQQVPWWWAVGLVGLGFCAFLVKETVVYLLPFCLLLAVQDLRKKRLVSFWLVGVGVGIVLLGLYFGFYSQTERGLWWRFEEIEAYSLHLKEGYLNRTSSLALMKRLTYGPLLFFIGTGMAVPLVFLLGCFLAHPEKQQWSLNSAQGYWFWAMVFMLAPLWLGTVSLDHYKPMSLVPRMLHPLLPTFCLSAGFAIQTTGFTKRTLGWLAGLFIMCAFLAYGEMKVYYVPFMLLFAAAWALPRISTLAAFLALPVLVVVQLVRPAYFIWKPSVNNYFAQAQVLDKYLPASTTQTMLLISDPMTTAHLDFFYGFEIPAAIKAVSFQDSLTIQNRQAEKVYLLINNGLLGNPEILGQPTDQELLKPFPGAKLIAQNEKVKLFLLPQKVRP
ncbi:glycosyltransferase family 39 protein [Rufibacter sp. LB8]|uniref:ArnT family glycosyltransferase n=1 Tax=Rufibacter sp. LB8 TaxID=2777781 RepID=UPI00178C7D99|nr:glycosyltransferase family 39 protein [Rufibacter sp. LB8]